MKGNGISANKLSDNAELWIKKLVQALTIKEYGVERSRAMEMRR